MFDSTLKHVRSNPLNQAQPQPPTGATVAALPLPTIGIWTSHLSQNTCFIAESLCRWYAVWICDSVIVASSFWTFQCLFGWFDTCFEPNMTTDSFWLQRRSTSHRFLPGTLIWSRSWIMRKHFVDGMCRSKLQCLSWLGCCTESSRSGYPKVPGLSGRKWPNRCHTVVLWWHQYSILKQEASSQMDQWSWYLYLDAYTWRLWALSIFLSNFWMQRHHHWWNCRYFQCRIL